MTTLPSGTCSECGSVLEIISGKYVGCGVGLSHTRLVRLTPEPQLAFNLLTYPRAMLVPTIQAMQHRTPVDEDHPAGLAWYGRGVYVIAGQTGLWRKIPLVDNVTGSMTAATAEGRVRRFLPWTPLDAEIKEAMDDEQMTKEKT